MTTRRSPHRALAYAAAALFTLSLGTAYAQPGGIGPGAGPGPGGPMGRGPGGGPGPGGPIGPGFGIEQTLEMLKGKLALNAKQQAQWDAAAMEGNSARDAGRKLMQTVKDTARDELAKAEPNLAIVASVADDAEQKGRDLRHKVRDQWLKLYAMLTPEQKVIVRDALQQQMNRMESFRERMGQRRGG